MNVMNFFGGNLDFQKIENCLFHCLDFHKNAKKWAILNQKMRSKPVSCLMKMPYLVILMFQSWGNLDLETFSQKGL